MVSAYGYLVVLSVVVLGRLVSTMVSEYASVVGDVNSHAAMSSILHTSVYLSTWLWMSLC